MDVVIPLSNESYWSDFETLYCLRSLEKHFSDLGEIYIVGGMLPPWLTNVNHIVAYDEMTTNKGKNIIKKLLLACNMPEISKEFIFLSDDQIFLKQTSAEEIKPYYVYNLKDFKFNGDNKFWMECLWNTRNTLLDEGTTCYMYEPHTPIIIDKNKFKSVISKYNWKQTLYPTLSLYFNNVIQDHKQLPENYRAFLDKEGMSIDLIEGKTFLGYSDLGLSAALQVKLQSLFQNKSKYEK